MATKTVDTMTLEEIRAKLEDAHPTLHEVKEGKQVILSSEDRASTLDEWAAEDFRTQTNLAASVAANRRTEALAAMREQWDGLPACIRGPFQPLFAAANALLDAGDVDAAIEMVKRAEILSSYSQEESDYFVETRRKFVAAFHALKG